MKSIYKILHAKRMHFKRIELQQLLDRLENSFRRLFSNKENAERLKNMFKGLRCNQLRESYDAVERYEEWRVEEKEVDDWWKSNHLISPTLYKYSKSYSKMYPMFCTPQENIGEHIISPWCYS